MCFLYDRELDFKEKLDLEELVVPPGSKPYIIGDSECRQVLMGMVGGALYASHGHIINARPRLVDGWHYRAHSKNDPVRARAAARRDNQSGLPLTPKHVTARKHRAEVVSILWLAGVLSLLSRVALEPWDRRGRVKNSRSRTWRGSAVDRRHGDIRNQEGTV